MNKFKSVVGRVNYSHEFDASLEKAIEKLTESKAKIVNLHLTMSEMQVLCLVEYKPGPKPKKPQQEPEVVDEPVVEEEDGSAEATTA